VKLTINLHPLPRLSTLPLPTGFKSVVFNYREEKQFASIFYSARDIPLARDVHV